MNPYQTPDDTTCEKCREPERPKRRRFSVAWIWFIGWLISMICAWSWARTAGANARRAESYLDGWEGAMDREDHLWERLAESQQVIDKLIDEHPDNPHREAYKELQEEFPEQYRDRDFTDKHEGDQ